MSLKPGGHFQPPRSVAEIGRSWRSLACSGRVQLAAPVDCMCSYLRFGRSVSSTAARQRLDRPPPTFRGAWPGPRAMPRRRSFLSGRRTRLLPRTVRFLVRYVSVRLFACTILCARAACGRSLSGTLVCCLAPVSPTVLRRLRLGNPLPVQALPASSRGSVVAWVGSLPPVEVSYR